MMNLLLAITCTLLSMGACKNTTSEPPPVLPAADAPITGAERTGSYFPLLEGKRIGLVVNHTSVIGDRLLPDTLLAAGMDIRMIFAPEHGFRGDQAEGATIKDGKDTQTGLPVVSLYGSKKKPGENDLREIDVLVFDIQDVGARFYTYISTMHYVMEAAAENGIPFIVLDRPNPNGFYVDGPALQPAFTSFVGKHPVPVVHGMTIGEYARMINGEGWLEAGRQCDLTVIVCEQYDHTVKYTLPIPPSPNLRSMRAIYLYPSLCFFEGTQVSVGRGTELPFEQFGSPYGMYYSYAFTPQPKGNYKPLFAGEDCFGTNLSTLPLDSAAKGYIDLSYLLGMYSVFSKPDIFFRKDGFFNLLAGSDMLRQQIEAGLTVDEIRLSWQEDVVRFKETRKKYLLYPDFE